MAGHIGRRKFLATLGAQAAWPLVARGQPAGMPAIGFLSSISPDAATQLVAAFHQGLKEQGYVEGRNVWTHYRWAEGRYDELESLATDLVQRKVQVIAATGGGPSVRAARKATVDIPILFISGFDPVKLGFVTSLNRPGGNVTGVSVYTTELASKRLALLHELVPAAHRIAIFVNPGSLATEIETRDVASAAQHLRLQLLTFNAVTDRDIDTAFDSAAKQNVGAFVVSADPYFTSRHVQIIALAARHSLPGIYPWRVYPETGGLISYGTELNWAYKQIGIYVGRILKGAKPADLPVQQPTTFDLVINLKTAKALGLEIAPQLLARADEVIE
jgi:putative tryptophan/tyrosine transport system substrate-binding protein